VLKAPNDIYLKDKKIVGVLTEVLQQSNTSICLFGIGMNVFSAPDLSTATCLKNELPKIEQKSWELFLKLFIAHIKSNLEEFSLNRFSNEMRHEIKCQLNAHPLLIEKYISVEPNGDLVTSKSRISWQQL
jgi:biotin-(acetyl-CoA carboxylase) ligase